MNKVILDMFDDIYGAEGIIYCNNGFSSIDYHTFLIYAMCDGPLKERDEERQFDGKYPNLNDFNII